MKNSRSWPNLTSSFTNKTTSCWAKPRQELSTTSPSTRKRWAWYLKQTRVSRRRSTRRPLLKIWLTIFSTLQNLITASLSCKTTRSTTSSHQGFIPHPQKHGKQRNITLRAVIDEQDKLRFIQTVIGDERCYLQILLNFLSNSLKFTNKGGSVTVMINIISS